MTAALTRTALRLLVIEALCPTGTAAVGPWPTIAGPRIYDSRLVPVDDLAEKERRPVVMVYTDEVEAAPRQTNGRLPQAAQLDLRIEIAIPQIVPYEVEDEDGSIVERQIAGYPRTDPEAEADLDLLEAQVSYALLLSAFAPTIHKLVGFSIREFSSIPFRSGEERVRMAMRSITFRLGEVRTDCFDMAPTAAAIGLARLPQPLRAVAEALPLDSYGRAVAERLAGRVPVAPVITPITGFGLSLDARPSRPVDPVPLPSASVEADVSPDQP